MLDPEFSTDLDHYQGNPDAPLVLVEYGDFECPDCGQAYPFLNQIKAEFAGRLCFVFRNMPLDQLYPIHPHATIAANGAQAAALQGKFWEMHDLLFENQNDLSEEKIVELAEKLGLNMEQFEEDFASAEVAEQVEDNLNSGKDNGVTSTPTFFLNGEKIEDSRNYEALIERLRAI